MIAINALCIFSATNLPSSLTYFNFIHLFNIFSHFRLTIGKVCDTIKAILCDIILITYIAKANFVRLIHRISFLNSFFGVERRSFPPPEQTAGSLSKQNFGSRFIIRHNAQKCPYCFTLTIKNIKRRSFALQSLCALLTRINRVTPQKAERPDLFFLYH